MPDLISETRKTLDAIGISPSKRLGQNFMVDYASLEAIAGALDFAKGATALEIGPGLGFLTRELLKRAGKVIAVEKDPALAAYLKKIFVGRPLFVMEKDVLKTDLKKDLELTAPIPVAGNIPYHITSPILEWVIGQRPLISEAVLTVQAEVADRLLAKPGSKTWGALSVFVNFYARPRLVRKIGRSQFWPSPNVDSAALLLDFTRGPAVAVKSEAVFFRLVRKAFQKRRKTLLNALSDDASEALAKAPLLDLIKKAGIDPRSRPETLSLSDWAVLSDLVIK